MFFLKTEHEDVDSLKRLKHRNNKNLIFCIFVEQSYKIKNHLKEGWGRPVAFECRGLYDFLKFYSKSGSIDNAKFLFLKDCFILILL